MSKPTIVIVPAAFSMPVHYDFVTQGLQEKGYEVNVLCLPSVASKNDEPNRHPPGMYDDAAFIAHQVQVLADAGKDVVLVGHSYGAIPMTQCTKTLSKEERVAQGKLGGIICLAYLTGLVPALRQSLDNLTADLPSENKLALKVDSEGWLYQDPIKHTAAVVLPEIEIEDALKIVGSWHRHSIVSFWGKLTHAGYMDIPTTYLLCEQDKCIPESLVMKMIKQIEDVNGHVPKVTRVATGHCPHMIEPSAVVDWIIDSAASSCSAS